MIGGQSVDVELEGKELTREQLDFIYRLKTGALIEASLLVGSEAGGSAREIWRFWRRSEQTSDWPFRYRTIFWT